MVRAVEKQVEGAIALVLFTLFLIIYISLFDYSILKDESLTSDKFIEHGISSDILERLSDTYYVYTINVKIPISFKEFCLNSYDPSFCKLPIYYKIFEDYSYYGIINNTLDSIYNYTTKAVYFYIDPRYFSCEDKNYILIRVKNFGNSDIYRYQLFLNHPEIIRKINQGYSINVVDLSSNGQLDFCYLHSNFVCDTFKENSIGIYVEIPTIKKSSSRTIKIEFISGTDNSKNGDGIFLFYYHFDENPPDGWMNTDTSCTSIDTTTWECVFNTLGSSIIYNNPINYNGEIYSILKYNSLGDLYLHITPISNYINYGYTNGVFDSKIGSFYTSEIQPKIQLQDSNNDSAYFDYLVIKSRSNKTSLDYLDYPSCSKKYYLIIGKNVSLSNTRADLSSDPSSIYNEYLKIEKSTTFSGYNIYLETSGGYTKILPEILSNYDTLNELKTPLSREYENIVNLGTIRITSSVVLFSDTKWIIVDTLVSTNTIPTSLLINNNLPKFQYSRDYAYSNAYSVFLDEEYSAYSFLDVSYSGLPFYGWEYYLHSIIISVYNNTVLSILYSDKNFVYITYDPADQKYYIYNYLADYITPDVSKTTSYIYVDFTNLENLEKISNFYIPKVKIRSLDIIKAININSNKLENSGYCIKLGDSIYPSTCDLINANYIDSQEYWIFNGTALFRSTIDIYKIK